MRLKHVYTKMASNGIKMLRRFN